MEQYPQESNSQNIGRRAVKLFSKIIPANWIEKELDGDSDYGLDFMIQYKDNQTNFVKYKFNVQLKGTENGDKISEDEIKIQVKTSTLNYYKNMELVLFVICDLNKGECYYEYIHNILVELDLDKNQEKHTLKIPKKNILNSDFEIGAILEKWAESNHKTHEDIVAFEKEIQTNNIESNICINKIEIKKDDNFLGTITIKTVPVEVNGEILNVSIYPVTFSEYNLFSKVNCQYTKKEQLVYPMTNISWDKAKAYCLWLGERIKKDIRMLSSLEWNYIVQKYIPEDKIFEYTTSSCDSVQKINDVKEDDLGLYNLVGNINEWCCDGKNDKKHIKGISFSDKLIREKLFKDKLSRKYTSKNNRGFRVIF